MLGWLSFIFILHYYVLNELKTSILLWILVHAGTIDLWSLFWALLSLLEGIFHPLFRGFVSMRLQSSCLLVTTIVHTIFWTAIQFCLWLLLLLIDYCCKVALSCSIDTGVILKPWDCSATVFCMPWYRQSWAMFFKPWPSDWRLSIEHLIRDLLSVNRLAP